MKMPLFFSSLLIDSVKAHALEVFCADYSRADSQVAPHFVEAENGFLVTMIICFFSNTKIHVADRCRSRQALQRGSAL